MTSTAQATLAQLWSALGGAPGWPAAAMETGVGSLPSIFPVTELAAASVGAAALAVAELVHARHGAAPAVTVDRRLASLWFGNSLHPLGWTLPPAWDPVAGDYRAGDGWIRLHTNAPHHRAAALRVLGVAEDRAAVAQAVRAWEADALEATVVQVGGCAAAMRTPSAWAAHPQGRAVQAEPLLHRDHAGIGPAPEWPVPAHRPLHGIRVLDMTRVLAGPVATRFLAGFGADVLRLDPPDWDEPAILPGVTLGKHCARLDLRRPDGLHTWRDLLRSADVLVHGYRPGALDHLVGNAGARQGLRPGLVEVSLNAYGWSGPWRGRRGFDSLVQMSTGVASAGMSAAGADRPAPLPVQALDHAAGYLMAAAAVRGLTGRLAGGRSCAACTSLARTAALLASMPPGGQHPLALASPGDYAPATEATDWGPALRLKPPCAVEGAPMRWDRPAGALGTAALRWP